MGLGMLFMVDKLHYSLNGLKAVARVPHGGFNDESFLIEKQMNLTVMAIIHLLSLRLRRAVGVVPARTAF